MKKNKSLHTEQPPAPLVEIIASQNAQTVSPDFEYLTEALKQRFADSLDAIILYGSCLHTSNLSEGIADFHVLVNDYRNAYAKRYLAYLNAWLPPNVFYSEVNQQEKIFRAKYAVFSTADFEYGNRHWFHPYLWARFAQPARLLYARDDFIRQRVNVAMAQAVVKFLKSSLLALEAHALNTEEIWTQGLMLTYAAELRAERATRARHLAQLSLNHYERLTAAALPALNGLLTVQTDGPYYCQATPSDNRRARLYWRLRRWQGRILSILRLSKATLTFHDYLNYAAWKIERHSGVRVEVTPMLRRYPILWGFKVMWLMLRRGILR
ncbi:hypothetical protein [Nitrosomonas communis]|uniref:Phosphatidate cytidylyltransferase n=1 Tax=Nitrosomonas communis TaxID=44574 RepID=A0A1H2UDS4_9PROT|nr:hypothetical protein [Nitrosomonas communis]SDW54068.1 hypothetical protein SAMN05421882_101551 [Nitrosomonas communis]